MVYDILIIGSGPGGYVAAIRAAQLGLKTAIIEKENLGGICLNWGCIPTKALLKSAKVFDYLKHAEDFGLSNSNVDFDVNKIVNRSREVADRMSNGVQFLMKKNKIDVFYGKGKILSSQKVLVTKDGEENILEGKNIIISTGARAREINALPQDGDKIIEYRKAITPNKIPKKLAIVGSGAIGLELAYFYAKMGSEVTLVEALERIAPNEESEISDQLRKSFKKNGIKIQTETQLVSSLIKDKKVYLELESKKGKEELIVDKVISAVGIQANIENIGLEELNIKVENGKISVDPFYQTNISNVFAIGDVISGPALAHVASAEAILCVEKIAGKNVEPIDYNNIPSCTYCSPEIASVGYKEDEAKDAGYEILVGKFPFSASGKAHTNGDSTGFVKLIFDKKYGELLGCHMIGDGVTEMITEAIVARKLETTAEEILKSIHPHPTLSEAFMEATADAYGESIHM